MRAWTSLKIWRGPSRCASSNIYSVIQKDGLNFVSVYFKIRTSDKYDSNDECFSSLEVECWNEDETHAAQQSPTVLMNSRTQKILCRIVAILLLTDAAHGCALGERSSGGIWKYRTSSFKSYVDHSHTLYSSGNIDVRKWVHLFESRCIILVPSIHNTCKEQMFYHNWVILGDMFRPLNGHPQTKLE